MTLTRHGVTMKRAPNGTLMTQVASPTSASVHIERAARMVSGLSHPTRKKDEPHADRDAEQQRQAIADSIQGSATFSSVTRAIGACQQASIPSQGTLDVFHLQ